MAASLASQISAHLTAKSLNPTPIWLNAFLASQKPTTPLAALKQTALFRLLASDITTSLQSAPGAVFPADLLAAPTQERTLAGAIPVQVLSVEDIGRSRWSQVEGIEAAERGETTKGREVVRVVPGEEGLSDPDGGASGPHKLLVQDAKGTKVFAFELAAVDGVNLGMKMGAKLILKNALVARGVVLLEPSNVTVLGGKIDALHNAWKAGRKDQLKAGIESGDHD